MKLQFQLVNKKYERSNENLSNNVYDFWNFYQGVNIAMAYLNKTLNVEDIDLRNRLFKKFLIKNDKKSKLKLLKLMNIDRRIISEFFFVYKGIEEKEETYGNMYRKGVIGVSKFEYR